MKQLREEGACAVAAVVSSDYRAKRVALQFLQGALRRKRKQESRGVARREGGRAAGKLSIFTEAKLRTC